MQVGYLYLAAPPIVALIIAYFGKRAIQKSADALDQHVIDIEAEEALRAEEAYRRHLDNLASAEIDSSAAGLPRRGETASLNPVVRKAGYPG